MQPKMFMLSAILLAVFSANAADISSTNVPIAPTPNPELTAALAAADRANWDAIKNITGGKGTVGVVLSPEQKTAVAKQESAYAAEVTRIRATYAPTQPGGTIAAPVLAPNSAPSPAAAPVAPKATAGTAASSPQTSSSTTTATPQAPSPEQIAALAAADRANWDAIKKITDGKGTVGVVLSPEQKAAVAKQESAYAAEVARIRAAFSPAQPKSSAGTPAVATMRPSEAYAARAAADRALSTTVKRIVASAPNGLTPEHQAAIAAVYKQYNAEIANIKASTIAPAASGFTTPKPPKVVAKLPTTSAAVAPK